MAAPASWGSQFLWVWLDPVLVNETPVSEERSCSRQCLADPARRCAAHTYQLGSGRMCRRLESQAPGRVICCARPLPCDAREQPRAGSAWTQGAQGERGCRVPVGSTALPFLKLSGDFPEEQLPHVDSWVGGHSTNKQSHHRTSIYEGDRVSPLLTSHYTEVPSRATAQQGRASRLAAAAARG